MTTHELAKLLLSKEDKPVYIKEGYEVQGEYLVGYSDIKGLDSEAVENAFIFDVDYLSAEPNDNFYSKGDAIVMFEDEDEKLPLNLKIKMSDMVYMLLEKRTMYHSWDIDRIGFYDDPDESFQRLLKHKVKIAIKSGFQAEWKEMDIQDALNWYKNNFNDYFENDE